MCTSVGRSAENLDFEHEPVATHQTDFFFFFFFDLKFNYDTLKITHSFAQNHLSQDLISSNL